VETCRFQQFVIKYFKSRCSVNVKRRRGGKGMFIKIRRIFNSISTKVILFIIILVLPLNLIAIMESNKVIDTMVEKSRESTQNLADTYMSEIGVRMANTQSLLQYYLTENPDFIKMQLQKENDYVYQSSKYKFFYSLRNMASMTDGGDGYFYYMKKIGDTLVYDDNSSESRQANQLISEFVTKQIEKGAQNGWHVYEFNSQQYLFFVVNSNEIAYGGWLNLDTFKVGLKNKLDYSNSSVSFSEKKGDISYDEWVTVSSSTKGIYLNISMKRTEIVGGISVYQKVLQVMAFVYLILIPVLYVFLRYLLILPLNNINNAHRQIQNGNQDFRVMETAKSVEYQEAYKSFNQMADNLKTLKIESYEKEIAKQKMELRNLQLQIRPHFLLNTFNMIFTLAQRKESAAIQDVIIYLSEYFRYIFRNDKELELFSKELKLIEGYMKMVSIRYSGNIKVDYEIDPEIEFVRIPPLLIHNFVENSVKYGVKQGVILNISILGKYNNKFVTFYIIDDGNGMDEETLRISRKLLNGETEPEKLNSHIGLLNSMKRLIYFYGEEANIEITSQRGKMTCIKVQFPYNLEVQNETFNG
jgi:two-component system sensor histidine kinase YesM